MALAGTFAGQGGVVFEPPSRGGHDALCRVYGRVPRHERAHNADEDQIPSCRSATKPTMTKYPAA